MADIPAFDALDFHPLDRQAVPVFFRLLIGQAKPLDRFHLGLPAIGLFPEMFDSSLADALCVRRSIGKIKKTPSKRVGKGFDRQ